MEECARDNLSALLPDLVDGFCRLDRHSYDADALVHLEDYMLAGHSRPRRCDLQSDSCQSSARTMD